MPDLSEVSDSQVSAKSLRLPSPTFPSVFKAAAIDGRSGRVGIRLRRGGRLARSLPVVHSLASSLAR